MTSQDTDRIDVQCVEIVLPPSATYRSRIGTWITPCGPGDGMLSLTTVAEKSYKIHQALYGIQEIAPEHFGTRRFQFEKIATDGEIDETTRVVTIGRFSRCTCEAGRMGFRRSKCKHLESIEHLLSAGQLPAKPIEGA
jgi:hypothetical protein